MIHDTKRPLDCCPRCRKAELAGRAMRRPMFSYDRLPAKASPGPHRIFHGDLHVATLTRFCRVGSTAYEIVLGDAPDESLLADSLQDARTLAEGRYTDAWRDGRYASRGPVRDLWTPREGRGSPPSLAGNRRDGRAS